MRKYTFDWRAGEHARVTSVLVREQFASGVWRVMKWAVFGILVLASVVTVAVAATGDPLSVLPLAILVIVVGCMVGMFGRLTGWIRAWQVRTLDPNVAHPIVLTLDDVGAHVTLHTINIDLKWHGLHKVRETTDAFMFYYNKRSAYFLPKRCLDGPDNVSALRSWIRERLPDGVTYDGV